MNEEDLKSAVVFDFETTGKDVGRDQIVQASIRRGLGKGFKSYEWKVRPTIAISEGAYEVHGISMEELVEEPPFKQVGKRIRKILAEANIWVGYNIDFDINILQSELKRNGLVEIDLSDKLIIDGYKLWRQMEPRKLENAYAKFVGGELEGAHDAQVDTNATAEILIGMIQHYGLEDYTTEQLALTCEPERSLWIGPSKHIQWNSSGIPIIGFGNKHADKAVMEVAKDYKGSGYLRWVMTSDFPAHVRMIAQVALMTAETGEKESKFIEWVKDTYGEPQQVGA
jgi:DNA polymerase-3 subunit epsilon